MSWFYLEERVTTKPRLVPDLVHHLQRRCVVGTCVIVVAKPALQLAVIRKEWLHAEYQVERQAASTLGERRAALAVEYERLQGVDFKPAKSQPGAKIVLVAPDDTVQLPEAYATLYILSNVTDVQQTTFASQLKRGGLIVRYATKK